jgi:membrane protease YdiL (CAAX protease family)
MPVENGSPGWWCWALLIPSLAAFFAILTRGIRPEPPGVLIARWNAFDLLIVLFVHTASNLLMARVVRIPFLPPIWGLGAALITADAITCLAVVIVAARSESVEALGLSPPRRPRNLAMVALACLTFLVPLGVVSWTWNLVLSALGKQPELQPALGLYIDARARNDWPAMALIGVGAVLMAPLAEELLFRGFLFGLLRRRVGPGVAMVATSAFFALFHLQPEVMLPIFLVGLVLNWIYLRTGSLAYPILFHLLFNGGTLIQVQAQ